jgi:hypothetical protein
VGIVRLSSPSASGLGSASTSGSLGRVRVQAKAPTLSAAWSATVSLNHSKLTLSAPTAVGSVEGHGVGDPGKINAVVSLFRRVMGAHFVGSSLAGATFVTMQRTGATHPVTEYDSQGGTNSDIISSTPVIWLDALVSNVGSSLLYLMAFDATSVPANGTLPLRQPIQVAAGAQTFVDLGDPGADGISGRPTQSGLVWAASTTATTLTIDGTSNLWVTARTIAIGT